VPELKNKNIYIARHSRSDLQTWQWDQRYRKLMLGGSTAILRTGG